MSESKTNIDINNFPADIRNRMRFIKFHKENAQKARKRYIEESISLYQDILKELGLDGRIIDTNGITGMFIIMDREPFDVIFKCDDQPVACPWRVKDDIYEEINHLTENFRAL